MTDTLNDKLVNDKRVHDKHGVPVRIGDTIRVLSLPVTDLPAEEQQVLNTFLGQTFQIESIEYDSAEVSQNFGTGDDEHWHTLFLWPEEFEKV